MWSWWLATCFKTPHPVVSRGRTRPRGFHLARGLLKLGGVSTLLLVEDEVAAELMTVWAFKEAHVATKLVIARDGAEAVDYLFHTGAVLPDAVLLDHTLPKISALEVLRRVRLEPRTQRLPVVVLVSPGDSMTDDVAQSYWLWANAHLRKPVDVGELRLRMAGVVDRLADD